MYDTFILTVLTSHKYIDTHGQEFHQYSAVLHACWSKVNLDKDDPPIVKSQITNFPDS